VLLAPAILNRLGIEHDESPAQPFFFGRTPPWMARGVPRYLGLHAYRRYLHLADRWAGA
jgi:hypothetical protein